jgi:hypothetical protein|tara:strand:+ start:92 stop:400 length:309 start_codon:yes stop_codon:yes gene_type:complete
MYLREKEKREHRVSQHQIRLSNTAIRAKVAIRTRRAQIEREREKTADRIVLKMSIVLIALNFSRSFTQQQQQKTKRRQHTRATRDNGRCPTTTNKRSLCAPA